MSLTTRPVSHAGSCRARMAGHWNLPPDAARRFVFLLAGLLLALSLPAPASADDDIATAGLYLLSGTGHQQGTFVGTTNLNTFLGADRFYNAGFTGSGAVIANIEAGHIWTGHESLSHTGLIPTSGAAGEFDRHATWVGSVLGGRQGGKSPGHYQQGMAPDAQLTSGAIATSWPTSGFPRFTANFHVNFSSISTYGPYRAAFITGVTGPGGTRTADVINSSYVGGTQSSSGVDRLAGTLDALVNENPRTLLTVAAGNLLSLVPSPASAYNNMAVAALSYNDGQYDVVSSFSNGGPSDYSDPSGAFFSQVRQVIDIAAPGENFSVAYYGGQTGGNGPTVSGPPNGPAGGPDWYTRNISGTSFASPTVGGGAALLYDAAYESLAATPDARDARVMKAVLMNSADKTLDWDNGQAVHLNGHGGVMTTRGLDNDVGAGRLNLDRAFDQLLGGTTDVVGLPHGLLGAVDPIGWDFGEVAEGLTNDYLISGILEAGSIFTSTLTWFRDRTILDVTNYRDASYDNLDLELWSVLGGSPLSLISESASIYNNTEHFHFSIPATGTYMLRVRWTGELFDMVSDVNREQYGLAWSVASVPEPATFVMLLLASFSCMALRTRRASPAA
ncbi:MAG TPA: S8 family serine peptidase [Lacipirellulaceae bacterium]|nr:S8 family serine peptidase [Lacipirellulaceae bacterium]